MYGLAEEPTQATYRQAQIIISHTVDLVFLLSFVKTPGQLSLRMAEYKRWWLISYHMTVQDAGQKGLLGLPRFGQ